MMLEAEARVMRHRLVVAQGTQAAPHPEAEKARQAALAALEKMLSCSRLTSDLQGKRIHRCGFKSLPVAFCYSSNGNEFRQKTKRIRYPSGEKELVRQW